MLRGPQLLLDHRAVSDAVGKMEFAAVLGSSSHLGTSRLCWLLLQDCLSVSSLSSHMESLQVPFLSRESLILH